MTEPQLTVLHFGPEDDFQSPTVEDVPASEAWRIGLSASDVRWLLGIPEPPRQPPSYEAQLRHCIREECVFVPGCADGWEVCPRHGVARKAASASAKGA